MKKKQPKIALGQMPVVPARPDLNVACMLKMVEQAKSRSVDIIVFPELCVSGYILGDLWEVDSLIEDFCGYSEVIKAASEEIVIIFGNVLTEPGAIGEDGRLRKYNVAHICYGQQFVTRTQLYDPILSIAQPKTLHPNYRFFDDDRHFYSLRIYMQAENLLISDVLTPFEVDIAGVGPTRIGLQLCEDMWFQDYEFEGEPLNPFTHFKAHQADMVCNLSASPWSLHKQHKRDSVILNAISETELPIYYVNQVGAQNNGKNILTFDGYSMSYDGVSEHVAKVPPWQELLHVVGEDEQAHAKALPMASIVNAIKFAINHLDIIRGRPNRYLVGVSGGVDSAVVLALLVNAVGSERVFAVNMPSQHNSNITQNNAKAICDALGVNLLVASIQSIYQALGETIRTIEFPSSESTALDGDLKGNYNRLVDENIQARIRGADMLAGIAAKFDLMFTNNGNKTEVALGYATLYGDVNGAVAPIADLYKTQVFELANYLNKVVFDKTVIPQNLLDGSIIPSAELSPEQDVSKGLGDPIKYGYHDALLATMIEWRRHPLDLLSWIKQGDFFKQLGWYDKQKFDSYFEHTGAWIADIEWIYQALNNNIFKRIQAPPIVVLSKRSFGFDLRESQLSQYWPVRYITLKNELLKSDLSTLISNQHLP